MAICVWSLARYDSWFITILAGWPGAAREMWYTWRCMSRGIMTSSSHDVNDMRHVKWSWVTSLMIMSDAMSNVIAKRDRQTDRRMDRHFCVLFYMDRYHWIPGWLPEVMHGCFMVIANCIKCVVSTTKYSLTVQLLRHERTLLALKHGQQTMQCR